MFLLIKKCKITNESVQQLHEIHTDIKIKGKITQEVILTLINLMREFLGDKNSVEILRGLKVEGKPSGRQLVYIFAESTTRILGKKGSFATLRQIGRELAKVMVKSHPADKWEFVLSTALNDLGFAQEIKRENGEAFICNCVFF